MMVFIIFSLIGILLSVFGFLVIKGKFLNLIAGYNMLSAEEKENVDKRKLSKQIGILSITIGIVSIISGIMMQIINKLILPISIIYSIFVLILTVIVVIKQNKD